MAGNTDTGATPLPMFYRAPEAIRPERHGDKALALGGNLGFAAKANVIPLMAAEMPAAMRSYPIVFSGPDFMPMIITGIRKDENLFVDGEGRWAEPHYIPAYVRRYPFILAGGDDDERLTLCIENDPARLVDADAKTDGEAKPLFVKDGDGGFDRSEVIDNALSFCEQYQGMTVKTRQIMKVIADSGLLAERTSKVTLSNGQSVNITGFHLVDETKLMAMSDKAFLKLRKGEALATIYCHLASMNSWTSILHQASVHRA